MIEYNMLRDLTLKAISIVDTYPRSYGRKLNHVNICMEIGKLIQQNNLFPSEVDGQEAGVEYNQIKQQIEIDDENKQTVKFILWDLIQESALLINNVEDFNYQLTEIGKTIINQQKPPYYDPDGYIEFITSQISKLDTVIKEYVKEGLSCYKQRLFFAAAVMFGAAAEKVLLLLLKSIGKAETDPGKKKKIRNLLDYPKLSEIISLIRSQLEELMNGKKKRPIPYKVHEGCMNHMVSIFEMIRVQRNDSTHPKAGKVNPRKVFSIIRSFAEALVVTYRLINWFNKHKI